MDSDNSKLLVNALQTIGYLQPAGGLEHQVAHGVAVLHRKIKPQLRPIRKEADYVFCDGIFLFVICDHFPRLANCDFEMTVPIAFLEYYVRDKREQSQLLDAADKFNVSENEYNQMAMRGSKPLQAIGNLCARWVTHPHTENLVQLTRIYDLLVDYVR